jgi:hypothetical protein
MAADEVDRDFPQQREILDGIAIPHPAMIFLEGDVENPMQAILDLLLSFTKVGIRCAAGMQGHRRDMQNIVPTTVNELARFACSGAPP